MRQSKLFTKTRKEAPADEVSKNAELLIRGGFIHKEMAGVYMYLPLGLKVLNKIEQIIREEVNSVGAQEISMTALQNPDLWKKSNRWDDSIVDNWFKTKLKNDAELGLGFSHEEPLVNMLKNFISSYKDLPISVYQFQNKFRNELRAKSGILRGREFLMKDMYSFHTSTKDFDAFYEKMKLVYKKIFERAGIGHLTYLTFASGGVFSKYSHEFQTLTSAGEDTIYIDEATSVAVNQEVYTDEVLQNLGLDKEKLVERKAIEVGNIFDLKSRFSEPFDLSFTDENGEKHIILMGCYGIGVGRLMGTVVEALSDDKGIIWPESIAPFKVHLLSLGESEAVKNEADKVYETLLSSNVEVIFDDRSGMSAGEKFADADLIGMPYRAVVSERSIKEGGVELKKRNEEKGKVVSLEELLKILSI
ncbi:MAG: His/Gly/Thr/Pro-type tRNA ligase C-terminal domain-containing protein [Candidatus Nomurabacteria bacterium]|nr:His/Gly/Thr/Pro-type tRNA ligase C-terminal domain-containing protein [Candidatus Nomurabacteria bacterium]